MGNILAQSGLASVGLFDDNNETTIALWRPHKDLGEVMISIGGENLIDLVDDGSSTGAPSYIAHPGGGPFNVATAAALQGAPTTYISPISTDRFGDMLGERLASTGAALGGPRVLQPTSLAVISLIDGIPSYGFYRDGTAERQVTSLSLDEAMPKNTNIFQLGGLALVDGEDAAVWETFASSCKDRGVLVSLDPNVRPSLIDDPVTYRSRIKRMMANTDILKLSDEDMFWLYDSEDFDAAKAQCLADSGAALTVITKGGDGADVLCRDVSLSIEAASIEVMADTVGAGDTFMASILAWLTTQHIITRDKLSSLSETELRVCLERAAKAAAINCTRHGCKPPTAAELD